MFRWPQTDNPIEWFLEWLIGTITSLFTWLWGALAAIFSGRGTFAQWTVIGLLVAVALLVGDAFTFQSLRR